MHRDDRSKRVLLHLILTLSLTWASGAAFGGILYDVDFATPPHTVGQPPAVGAGPSPRATVSTNSGSPEVVAQSGFLDQQPVEFDRGLEQIRFELDDLPLSTTYRLECDLLLDDSSNVLSYMRVSFATPTVRNINFIGSGAVEYHLPPLPAVVFTNFALNAIVHLRVDIDLAGDVWRIFLDDTLRHSGSFGNVAAIEYITVASTGTTAFLVRGGVDNILIESDVTIPVESTSWSAVKSAY